MTRAEQIAAVLAEHRAKSSAMGTFIACCCGVHTAFGSFEEHEAHVADALAAQEGERGGAEVAAPSHACPTWSEHRGCRCAELPADPFEGQS